MPTQNQFRHQAYDSGPPAAAYEILRPALPQPIDSEQFQQNLRQAGQMYREAGVQAIYLMHGTFVGTDASGWIRKLRRIWPSAGTAIERSMKSFLNSWMADAGNYTLQYAERLAQLLSDETDSRIPVNLCVWSSENHHIGRADGAVRLLEELLSHPAGSRILVWAHSHGGNVLALVTNLIAADEETRSKFFDACRAYYCFPWTKHIDLPGWKRVIEAFDNAQDRQKIDSLILDIATFGTPIRYGWDCDGYDHLLHFVNHRPLPNQEPYVAMLPKTFDEVKQALGGDYVQQFGVAGSNLPPGIFSWRAGRANRRLSELVQGQLAEKSITARLAIGRRVADEGTTLLVDYQDNGTPFATHLAGHAIYTRMPWMAFHALEIAKRFYGKSSTVE